MDRQKTSFAWLGRETFGVPTDMTVGITPEENMAYAKALVLCAKGDGEITQAERDWLIGYSVTQGHADDVVDTMSTYDGGDSIEDVLGASPAMPSYSRFLLYDALRACASDGELAPGERDRVLAAADQMQVPREVVEKLEAIVDESAALRQRLLDTVVGDTPLAPAVAES